MHCAFKSKWYRMEHTFMFWGEHRLSAHVYGALTDHAYPLNSSKPERLLSFSSAPSLPIHNPSSLIQNSCCEAFDWAAAVTVATALKSIVDYILGSVYAALMLFGFVGGCVIKTTLSERRRQEGKLPWSHVSSTPILVPSSFGLGSFTVRVLRCEARAIRGQGLGDAWKEEAAFPVSGLYFVSITEVISINQWFWAQIMGRKWHKLPCASSISNGRTTLLVLQ